MVMKRWSKEAGETTIPPKIPRKYLDKAAQVSRYSALISQCSQACLNYSFSDEGFNAAMIEFGRMNEESMKYKDANQEEIPNVPELNPNVLRDPPVAKTKGMHTNRTNNIESSKAEQRVVAFVVCQVTIGVHVMWAGKMPLTE
ncbi:hypothetical protein M0R45_008813 [Rubus argutus]